MGGGAATSRARLREGTLAPGSRGRLCGCCRETQLPVPGGQAEMLAAGHWPPVSGHDRSLPQTQRWRVLPAPVASAPLCGSRCPVLCGAGVGGAEGRVLLTDGDTEAQGRAGAASGRPGRQLSLGAGAEPGRVVPGPPADQCGSGPGRPGGLGALPASPVRRAPRGRSWRCRCCLVVAEPRRAGRPRGLRLRAGAGQRPRRPWQVSGPEAGQGREAPG